VLRSAGRGTGWVSGERGRGFSCCCQGLLAAVVLSGAWARGNCVVE
jgi:hypothetical protein